MDEYMPRHDLASDIRLLAQIDDALAESRKVMDDRRREVDRLNRQRDEVERVVVAGLPQTGEVVAIRCPGDEVHVYQVNGGMRLVRIALIVPGEGGAP